MKLKLLLILVFSFFSQFLFSQSQEPVKLFLSNATANIGDTVTIDLTVKNFKNLDNFYAYIEFDSSSLTFIDFQDKAINELSEYSAAPILPRITLEVNDSPTPLQLADNSVLIKIRFRVKAAQDNSNSIIIPFSYVKGSTLESIYADVTFIAQGSCININNKPLSKLKVETQIQLKNCKEQFYIALKNIGQTTNIKPKWEPYGPLLISDTLHLEGNKEFSVALSDDLGNKSQLFILVQSNFFYSAKYFELEVNTDWINCQDSRVVVNALGGTPPFKYRIDNSPFTTNNTFMNVNTGNHNISIIDSTGCITGRDYPLEFVSLDLIHEFGTYDCNVNKGQLTINVYGGSPDYKIYLDDDLKAVSATVLLDSVTLGAHRIKVIDAIGCEKQKDITLTAKASFTVFPFVYGGDCIARNLKIDVFNTTQPFETYRYQLDNNAFQPLPNFLNVPVGTHTITVRDINGCEIKQTVEIKPVSNTYYTKEIIKTDCVNRVFDFKIKPYNGVAPYKIKYTTESGVLINPVDSVFKNVPETYSGHNIEITDAQGCILKTRDTVYARNLIGLDLSWNYEASSCSNKGKLTLILRGGDANRNFQFKLDNGAFSNNLIYENVDAGLHKLFVQAEGFCNDPITLDLKAASAITYKKSLELGCGNVQNILFIIPNGGIAPYKIYLNNVLNPNGEVFFNVEKGIYTVKIEDANGCSITKKDTLFNVPAFEVKGDTFCRIADSMFLIPKINFTENRQLSYLWSNGSTNSTLRLFKPQPMIYTVTVTDSGSNGICSKVASFFILPQCVWPGDTDTSGVVNARDLFNIGIAYGETGFKRDSMDIRWYPHISKEWLKYTPNVFNYKHIDTNGDGIINDSDTSAIAQNWGLIHELKSSSIPLANRGAAPFIYIKNEPVIDGSNSLQIILGDGNLIAQNVYGVAFTIDFDENVIDERSVYAAVRGSWLVESNVLSMYKVNAGKIHIVIVRKNKIATNGAGNIARIYFNTKKNVLLKNIPFSIENQQVINEKGQEVPVLSRNTIINSTTPTIDIESDSEIKLYPNPAIDKINIESIDSPLKEIVLTNMMGTVLKTYQIASKISEIELSDLPSGTYFLRIKTEKNTQMKYFIKP